MRRLFAGVGPVGNIIGGGNTSTASGNYIYAPVSSPTDTCGISIAFIGFSAAGCQGGAATFLDSLNTFGLIPS